MDTFADTRITYSDGVNAIEYRRTNRGWEPNTSKSKLNGLFPFASCCFIAASGFRFYEPNADKFYKKGGCVVYSDASSDIKNGLNEVFHTRKFDNLKYVTIRSMRGRQKRLHRSNRLYVIYDGSNVYSEMNFSLGERLVLNTLDFFQEIPNNVLLLIDEIELALHPTAQISFYDYVKKLANSKKLTCIISTHSSSLIKAASSRIYLDNNDGVISVLKKCEPAYILRDLTLFVDNRPDYLFLVEDIMAFRYLNAVLRKYQQTEDKYVAVKITCVGGYEQVIRLAESFYTIPPFDKRIIQSFLDADVQQTWDCLERKTTRTQAENKKLDLLNRNRNNISMLDITPELGVWNWLRKDASIFEATFISEYGPQMFKMRDFISEVILNEGVKNQGNAREYAKGCFKNLTERLMAHIPGISEETIFDMMFRSYVDDTLSDLKKFNEWKSIFKYIFNRRQLFNY